MKILVPIDGSEFSNHSLEFVASRTTLLGSNPEIELMSVQAPVPARASRLIGSGSLRGYYDEEANTVLEPAVKELEKAGVKAATRFAVGEAAPVDRRLRLGAGMHSYQVQGVEILQRILTG